MKLKRLGFYQLIGLFAVNIAIIIYFWSQTSGSQIATGLAPALIAIGRLCGLMAVLMILMQLTMISRVRFLEQKMGFDGVTKYHRANGQTLLFFIFFHPILITTGYSLLTGTGIIKEELELWAWPHVLLAVIAWCIFMTLGIMAAVRWVRSKLSYEAWYYTHIFMYLAIVLAFFHQTDNGADFADPIFKLYWKALYVLAFSLIIIYRFGIPLIRNLRHDFRVERVERITPSAVSIYVTGKNLSHFKWQSGQFNISQFLVKGYWWERHPFTISIEPNGQHLRISAKGVGDFTKRLEGLPVGSRVWVDGPYGVFTPKLSTNKKVLLIAGGSGITPLRAMLPQLLAEKRDVVLLYGNQTVADTMLTDELEEFAATYKNFKWHNILTDDPGGKGDHGYIDNEVIARLVPEVARRDVYLCGPPAMRQKLVPILTAMEIPEDKIFYEQFRL